MEGSAAVVSITPAFAMSPGVNPYKIYKNYTQYFETNMNTGVSTPTVMFTVCFSITNVGGDNYVQFVGWANPAYSSTGYKDIIITTLPKNMDHA